MFSKSTSRRIALKLAVAALLSVAPTARAEADDLRVITSGAFTPAYKELAPKFEQATGHKLISSFGASFGGASDSIPVRLARGEPFDVIILSRVSLDALTKEGYVVQGSSVDLVSSTIGMSVRAGAPKPDISTMDALRRTLLAAKSVAFSASNSGTYLSTVLFPRLGIAEEMKPKNRRISSERSGAVVARGEAELAFEQISELLPVPGIEFVGPLPPEAQRVTVYAAGIIRGSKAPDAAKALIRYLASPDVFATIRRTGLTPVNER